MQHNDGKHAEIDGVMSNLEFFAAGSRTPRTRT